MSAAPLRDAVSSLPRRRSLPARSLPRTQPALQDDYSVSVALHPFNPLMMLVALHPFNPLMMLVARAAAQHTVSSLLAIHASSKSPSDPPPVLPPVPFHPCASRSEKSARRRYHIFRQHYDTLLRLRAFFPFHLIDGMGTLSECREQVGGWVEERGRGKKCAGAGSGPLPATQ